jgi:hypothetical protein
MAYLMFKCPVTTTARAQMYNVIKASIADGESKLQQCLNLSCDKMKVAALLRFVSCDLWNDKHALVS